MTPGQFLALLYSLITNIDQQILCSHNDVKMLISNQNWTTHLFYQLPSRSSHTATAESLITFCTEQLWKTGTVTQKLQTSEIDSNLIKIDLIMLIMQMTWDPRSHPLSHQVAWIYLPCSIYQLQAVLLSSEFYDFVESWIRQYRRLISNIIYIYSGHFILQ